MDFNQLHDFLIFFAFFSKKVLTGNVSSCKGCSYQARIAPCATWTTAIFPTITDDLEQGSEYLAPMSRHLLRLAL